MCFPFDAIVPDLPRASGHRRRRRRRAPHADLRRRHRVLAPTSPAPKARPASSSCPTCAACSASTSSSPSASPRPGTRRSRSTTSAAPPGSARATRTSSTCPHVEQTTPETVALDVEAALAGARRRARGHGRLLLRRRAVVHVGRRGPRRAGRRRRLLRLARARAAQRWALDRAPETKVPVLGLFARRRREHHARPGRGVRRGAPGRARDPHLRGRAALLLRPPPGGLRGRVPGRVGAHPRLHRRSCDRAIGSITSSATRGRRAGARPGRVDAWRCARPTPTPRAAFDRCTERAARARRARSATSDGRRPGTVTRRATSGTRTATSTTGRQVAAGGADGSTAPLERGGGGGRGGDGRRRATTCSGPRLAVPGRGARRSTRCSRAGGPTPRAARRSGWPPRPAARSAACVSVTRPARGRLRRERRASATGVAAAGGGDVRREPPPVIPRPQRLSAAVIGRVRADATRRRRALRCGAAAASRARSRGAGSATCLRRAA